RTAPSVREAAGEVNVPVRDAGARAGAANCTVPSLRTAPPRRFAPPLLVEEGNALDFALLCRRAGRDNVADRLVLRRFKPDHPVASRHPFSTRRGACCVHFCPPR